MNESTLPERKSERVSVSSETLDELVRRLVKGLQPEKIILFGSHAYGHPTSESDLDIVIVVPESNEPS